MQTIQTNSSRATLAGQLDGVLRTFENIDSLRNQDAPGYVIPYNCAFNIAREIAHERRARYGSPVPSLFV